MALEVRLNWKEVARRKGFFHDSKHLPPDIPMRESLVLTDSVEPADSNSMMLGHEDFRIPGYMVETVDDGDDEEHDGGDENAFPYHSEDYCLPTSQKLTFHYYLGVDEEGRW